VPSNFEILFGSGETNTLRTALGGRSGHVTSLSLTALEPFRVAGGRAAIHDLGGTWLVDEQHVRGNYTYQFIATRNRLNYFCNAHTIRHCDFSDNRGVGRAQTIELWPATKTQAQVQTDIEGLIANHTGWMQDLADVAVGAGGWYAEQIYHNDLDIGLKYAGDVGDVSRFFVNHFSPVAQNRYSRVLLKAVRHLFQ
jgi:hypothetical protein